MYDIWPWLPLALLGAYHGLNPGMGWLFAVALGLQERRRVAVLRAFAPIALGHAASIAAVVVVVGLAQAIIPVRLVQVLGGAALLLFGMYKIVAPLSHPRWVGMRVTFRDLTIWSFLMATAHGAGLMLTPLLRVSTGAVAHAAEAAQQAHAVHSAHHSHVAHAAHIAGTAVDLAPLADVAAIGLHTAAMFLVMALIALVVYEKIGRAILRRAWFNLDRVWASALIVAALITLVIV